MFKRSDEGELAKAKRRHMESLRKKFRKEGSGQKLRRDTSHE